MPRIQVQIRGVVQGVGFRPFVYRLAKRLELGGWVRNTTQGVIVALEGPKDVLEAAVAELRGGPPAASVRHLEFTEVPPDGSKDFMIVDSGADEVGARIGPDLATCPDCIADIFNPANKRHGYPFTNCTECGPRLTIALGLPYDRAQTTMAPFTMCTECEREFTDPEDRRFHAQPNCCPECGPVLVLRQKRGQPIATGDKALRQAVGHLKAGKVVAVKGLGGFHLMVDATDSEHVQGLRRRKRRPDKPFAVMFRDVEQAKEFASVSDDEAAALVSPAAPIVLLDSNGKLPSEIDPVGSRIGAFLAHTPLHHFLMQDLGPLIATSANLAGEPLAIRHSDVFEQLGNAVDFILDHDREIARPVEDSVLEIVLGETLIHRFGRGLAPDAIDAIQAAGTVGLAAHMKAAIAVSTGREIVLGPHVGDLESPTVRESYDGAVRDLPRLLNVKPDQYVSDKHPEYYSTLWAEKHADAWQTFYHHHAHVVAVAREHGLGKPYLGVAWDGLGYGDDETFWGGEFFRVDAHGYHRTSVRPYRWIPGQRTVTEPWRSATAILCALGRKPTLRDWRSDPGVNSEMLDVMASAIDHHGAETTSVGRLFDGMASLLGLVHLSTYEAHAAQALQALAESYDRTERVPEFVRRDWVEVVDWALSTEDPDHAAWRFHAGLADLIVWEAVAHDLPVVLSGGCFQNRLLLRRTVEGLRAKQLEVYWPNRFPVGDGAIAVGQVALFGEQSLGEV